MADATELEPARETDPPFVADGMEAGAYNEEGVDLTLIRMFLRMTPAERLDAAGRRERDLRIAGAPRRDATMIFDDRRALARRDREESPDLTFDEGGCSLVAQISSANDASRVLQSQTEPSRARTA